MAVDFYSYPRELLIACGCHLASDRSGVYPMSCEKAEDVV